ncbi:MAG: efflux RND transporter periplasmic adaptor subunit [Candidatus Hydrogenedens sp.]|nr:efflux RND transporter periplasmic adaptor subunit [Candidatus Hydrogenedens sp.]
MTRIFINAAVCVAIAAAGGFVVYQATLPGPAQAEAVTTTVPPTNVEVVTLEPRPFSDMLYLTGQLLAWEDIGISAEANGVIEWQGIEVGQQLHKGDELYHIDTTAVQADYARAKAQAELARAEMKRTEGLRQSGVASSQVFDQAAAELKLAEAGLRTTEIRLERSIVRAPIDGVVSSLTKELGEFADFGMELCRLVRVDILNSVIPVPERDIPHFKVGQEVDIRFDALPDQVFTGEIFRIAPKADTSTRTFPVEIEIDNAEGVLRPGMTARASLVRQVFEDAIVVPVFAVRAMENQYFVMVEQDGTAHTRAIIPGRLQGSDVQVLEGLHAGERLIVSGHRELRDGAPVAVRDTQPS